MILSFIVPVYNTEKYLRKCIESILSQTNEDVEVIIINDESTDNSLQLIEQLRDENNCIKLINQPNKGLGAARNAGLRIAQGEYVFFVDSDDYLPADSLKKLLDEAQKRDCEIIGFDVNLILESGKIKKIDHPSAVYNKEMTGADFMCKHNLKSGSWAYLFSRTFLLTHDLWMPEGIFHEDELFTPRAFVYANKLKFLPHIGYCYQWCENSITRTKDMHISRKKIDDRLTIEKELLLLHNTEKLSIIQKKGLKRKIDFLIVDLIINLVRFGDRQAVHSTMKECRKMKLFPLNNVHYSLKYDLFRIFFKNEKQIDLAMRMKIIGLNI